ncbi:MAG: inositol-3-phosphate synthase [Desulfobulbaceae bacterium]|nr:inositol-3-phosphate synthase [Desulfobulbaceae bacterium]
MKESKPHKKTGVWLVGGLGSIAVTVMVGALGFRKGLVPSSGMVTESEAFSQIELPDVSEFEFGGWDIRQDTVYAAAQKMVQECRTIDPSLLGKIAPELDEINRWMKPGLTRNCGQAIESLAAGSAPGTRSLLEEVNELRSHLRSFKEEKGLTGLVVINLASTEPSLDLQEHHESIALFEARIAENKACDIRASSLYSYAALLERCPVINFTPSPGTLIPALIDFAGHQGLPVMGNDGKTGETLVKSALAPMFLSRNLEILSWEGFNILGNMDGEILNTSENRATKIKSKDKVLSGILGYQPHSRVHINYVPSLGDQKTAWDFIHFQGFLGAKMSLQFTWQAYDSLLAAPLVLDLVRLAQLAKERGESGVMPHLASFFKAPLGTDCFDHHQQTDMLVQYISQVTSDGGESWE